MPKARQAFRTCVHAIYAREVAHRSANIIQQAIAALYLSSRAHPGSLDVVMSQMTGAADLHRALGNHSDGTGGISDMLEVACEAAVRAAGAHGRVRLNVSSDPLLAHLPANRPLLMIAAELVSNCVKHAFDSSPGSIMVTLSQSDDRVVLFVEDDGECHGWDRPGGQGHGIVDDLASALCGRVQRSITSSGSARVKVEMPSTAALVASEPACHA